MFYLFITLFLLGIITTLFFINKKSKKLKTPTEIKFDLSICNGGGYYICFINSNLSVPEDVSLRVFIKTNNSFAPYCAGEFKIPLGNSKIQGNSPQINGRFEYAELQLITSSSNKDFTYTASSNQTNEYSGPCF